VLQSPKEVQQKCGAAKSKLCLGGKSDVKAT